MTRHLLLLAGLLTLAPAACGDDDEGPPQDACGRTWQRCSWNEGTGEYDRNCVPVAPPDAGSASCDGGSVIPADDAR